MPARRLWERALEGIRTMHESGDNPTSEDEKLLLQRALQRMPASPTVHRKEPRRKIRSLLSSEKMP
jgi:hypothetical protein